MMKHLSTKDQDLVQRYIDGETSPEETLRCEQRCASEPNFRDACDEQRRLRELLASGGRIASDPAFWSKLSLRLGEQEDEKFNLLPFPQKYLPLAASAFALLVLVSFSYVFENRLAFLRFWETQSEVVRTAYEQSVQEGSFIPLFSGIDNDKTLQFALYGSLQLDEAGGTMLNVDERSAEGYRIEVQKEQPRKQRKVTVADFVAEVRPTNIQKAAIESLLTDARKELESSVLVGRNDVVAINADLSRLNRAMASGLVGVLEPDQRVRLKRLLTQEDAAYSYSSRSRSAQPVESGRIDVQVPRPQNRFVVLSPETVMIQALTIDIDRIHKEMRESQDRFREVQALREKSIQWLVNEPFVRSGAPAPNAIAPRVSLKSRKDRLTIHIQADTSDTGFLMFHAIAGGVYVQNGDSLVEYRVEAPGAPPEILIAPQGAIVTAPRPDSVRPRKPFKLDIN